MEQSAVEPAYEDDFGILLEIQRDGSYVAERNGVRMSLPTDTQRFGVADIDRKRLLLDAVLKLNPGGLEERRSEAEWKVPAYTELIRRFNELPTEKQDDSVLQSLQRKHQAWVDILANERSLR